MADPVVEKAAKPACMRVRILGKVTRVRKYEKHTYTTIITPAPDEYSKPNSVELRSKARFADAEDKVDVMASLGGYEGKAYRVVDKDSGETKMLTPVNHFLDLVE